MMPDIGQYLDVINEVIKPRICAQMPGFLCDFFRRGGIRPSFVRSSDYASKKDPTRN